MFIYLVLLNPFLAVGLELTVLEQALVPGPALLPPLKVLQPDKAQGTKEQFTLIFIELPKNYLNNNMGPLALIEKLLALKKIGLLFSEMIISNLHSFRFR